MYSSGIVRYHPLHDPESQQQSQPRPLIRSSVVTFLDPRSCRSYIAHVVCALFHFLMVMVALRGWSSCGLGRRADGSYCDAERIRVDIPFGAFVVAGIVGFVNWLLVLFTAPLEVHIISLPIREFSAARYVIYYIGCIFCTASAIVDFKYAVRAGIHSSGWGHMYALEMCAIAAGMMSIYVVAVDGFKVYTAWNVAQACAGVPKIKVEDTDSDIKSKEASMLKI